ncbi:gp16 family protein [Sphingorhabdus sp. 109]|uniref:gp16 family protein n=1 Tax=Sphingorhabdus sp. 109 TaxID=2653173 RepID=UPI0012F44962|nr:regulatory protein GemA [Sphingorhabdus sp. 109]VWX62542.1 conserved hypothetical protein [Sphingorhabdus sp. 109]
MNAPARKATFSGVKSHRNSMIGKIHVARKQLNMVEDDYRQLLLDTTGEISLTKCGDAQLVKMVDALKAKGFQALPTKRKTADHPVARKARALWISLYHLNAIENPSDQALEAFARRQLRAAQLQWADQTQGYKLIEALKQMAERHGWSQEGGRAKAGNQVHVLQRCLCEAIRAKLEAKGLCPHDWTLEQAAYRLSGQRLSTIPTIEELSLLAKALGNKLRENK